MSAITKNDNILDCLNQYHRDIVNVLYDCACVCIPQKKHGVYKFWGIKSSPCLKMLLYSHLTYGKV